METELLLAKGFKIKTYEGQEGEFVSFTCKAESMPYVSEYLVDDDFIFGDMDVFVEVTPAKTVHLYIPDADYMEGPFPVDSEDAQRLLREALAAGV